MCGGTLWSTGEQLRNARDPAVIRRLQPVGPLIVDGLQGNAVQLLRPQNEPPFETYFIDYDDRFDDPQTRGHLGDVVIWRVCGQAVLPLLVPVVLVCPVGLFNVDGICRAGLACPPGTEFSNGCCTYRGCPPSYARIRGRCVPPPLNCRPTEVYANSASPGHCEAPKCPPGQVVVARKAASGPAQSNGVIVLPPGNSNCPPGTVLSNDQCQPSGGGQNMCVNYCGCPEGMRLSEDGTCKPPNDCGPVMVARDGNTCGCPEGTRYIGDGICQPVSGCPEGTRPIGDGVCQPVSGCPEGTLPNADGRCVCRDGAPLVNGICCTREAFTANRCGCPEDTWPSVLDGSCKPRDVFTAPLCVGPNCPTPPGGACPGGRLRNSDGNCPPPQVCTGGKIFDGNTCRCEAGKIENESGQCERPVTVQSKKPKKKRKPPPPKSSETPQSSPGISIGIGIGGGGRGPSRGTPMRPPGGGGGKGSNPG